MAIRRRNQAPQPLQVPAPMPKPARPHVPSPDAVLPDIPMPQRRLAGIIGYGGADPKDMPLDDLACVVRAPFDPKGNDNIDNVYRNRIKGRLSAIRAMCVQCTGGSTKEVRLCTTVECPLWLFRMGSNPLRARSK